MYKLQNVMSTILERDNAYEDMFKDVKTMVNSKWTLGPSQRVRVAINYFALTATNIYSQNTLQIVTKDLIFQPNRPSYRMLNIDVKVRA
jgi:hypothetical protein